MKILLVSSYLPFPLFSGGHIRLYNILKGLAANHEVTLVCEKRAYQTENDIKEVQKICKEVFVVDRKKQWSINNIVKTGFSSQAFLIRGHEHVEMKQIVQRLLDKETFNLIHVETSYVLQNVPETKIPIVLVEHNIEYLVYKRFVGRAPIYLRPLLTIDVMKLQQNEKNSWKRATHIVTVSEEEKRIIGMENVSVVPNGVDTKRFSMKNDTKKTEKREKRVLFIGDFKWVQNRDAATYIIRDIWPKIKSKSDSNTILWIVGKQIPAVIRSLSSDETILFDENARQKTEEIFQQADVLLTPIRVGAGTQYKILEAMAVGTPVVTTTLGLEGVHAVPEKDILIGDTSEVLAAKTIELLTDEAKAKEIAQNARKVIEKEYTWDTIVKTLEDVYKKVV